MTIQANFGKSSPFQSFELHLLSVIRREHQVKMSKVRNAVDYLRERLGVDRHPLIHAQMQTDGVDLFIEHLGALINISQKGQQAMRVSCRLYF